MKTNLVGLKPGLKDIGLEIDDKDEEAEKEKKKIEKQKSIYTTALLERNAFIVEKQERKKGKYTEDKL